MPAYQIDPDLEVLGKDIITKRRPYLGHVTIVYLFRPEAPVSDGKATAGMCIRVDDRNRAIHKADFIIEISKDIWTDATDEFRRAIMDHELGHCGLRMDEGGEVAYDELTNLPKTYIKRHSIEEFDDVLEEHGAYHAALRDFLNKFALHKSKKAKKEGPDLDQDSDE